MDEERLVGLDLRVWVKHLGGEFVWISNAGHVEPVADDASVQIAKIAELSRAIPGELSFFTRPDHPRYRDAFLHTKASVVLVSKAWWEDAPTAWPKDTLLWVCARPYVVLAQLADALRLQDMPRATERIHPTAVIEKSATLAADVRVGAGAVVKAGAHLGAGCILHAQTFVGQGAHLGERVQMHPGARVLWGCILGDDCILHPGATVGADGFGYAEDEDGSRVPIPQMGIVVLGDRVDLGAHSVVDRATFGKTQVGSGTKIDNLVQVAHNVILGKDCVLVSQSGLAGSAQIGDRVIFGAQSGSVGHVRVASDIHIAGRGAVVRDLSDAGVYGGLPAIPQSRWLRNQAASHKGPEILRRLRRLEAACNTQDEES